MRALNLLALSAVAAALTFSAFAQEDPNYAGGSADPEFEGNAGAIIINGLKVIKRQDLDFGVIAPSVTESGTVKVNRGRNFNSVCSPELTCLQPGNRARFTVVGEPNRYYTIADPGQIWINNGENSVMRVDTFFGAGSANETDWRGWQRLRGSGIARFNVGAILHVNPNQPVGTYTGSFTITVEYQ